mmetsp:Transcript_92188/g.169176  ORF Transcript_92188/g.169176 Transcript_92188/m.169176 type:complete len:201 (-) Transcript_92188:2340-2942(-)
MPHDNKLTIWRYHIEPCDIDVQIPEVESHSIKLTLSKNAKSAFPRSYLDKVVAITKALHCARQLPMLLRVGHAKLPQDFPSRDFAATAQSVSAGLSHRLDTRSLSSIFFVCNAGCANTSICCTLHLQIVSVECDVSVALRWLGCSGLAVDVPDVLLLVWMRPLRRLSGLSHDRQPCLWLKTSPLRIHCAFRATESLLVRR